MVYTGKLFGFEEFFEIFQEYSRNMQIFNVHPGTFSTFQEYAWYIVCCTGTHCQSKKDIGKSDARHNCELNYLWIFCHNFNSFGDVRAKQTVNFVPLDAMSCVSHYATLDFLLAASKLSKLAHPPALGQTRDLKHLRP